jgi:succinyl-CoA synthetase beta subunit
MKLKEFQAKAIFRKSGLPIPRGVLAASAAEAEKAAGELGGAVVLKPQLDVKGRGKVGGIGFADDPTGALREADRLFSMVIHGEKVERLLIEEKIDIRQEMYLAVLVDYAERMPLIMASDVGGIDIEDVSREDPGRIIRIHVPPGETIDASVLKPVAEKLGKDAAEIMMTLHGLFSACCAETVEINPLVRAAEGRLVAVDAVLNVDDDALYKNEDLMRIREETREDDLITAEARDRSWTYIDLPGTVGILSSGAGLTMAIMDMIHHAGGAPANFLDTAQIDDEGIYDAFDLIMRAKPVKVLLINIFAGLNRCDLLARGIRRFVEERRPDVPMVVRMIGNKEEAGYAILKDIGIPAYASLEEAVSKAVKLGAKA